MSHAAPNCISHHMAASHIMSAHGCISPHTAPRCIPQHLAASHIPPAHSCGRCVSVRRRVAPHGSAWLRLLTATCCVLPSDSASLRCCVLQHMAAAHVPAAPSCRSHHMATSLTMSAHGCILAACGCVAPHSSPPLHLAAPGGVPQHPSPQLWSLRLSTLPRRASWPRVAASRNPWLRLASKQRVSRSTCLPACPPDTAVSVVAPHARLTPLSVLWTCACLPHKTADATVSDVSRMPT